ncbi:glycosyl hydrolase family 18 protein [Saccharopolyspora phatthalungensis]|uniref:Spore germination protein YaaH n=1 Tax=Saccharopolyspora phatthalungensis TaxID=664693 RepID=A0A840Q5Q1_9PSEU|nr:glycosyl hydrolase family 18 protein [Saccharopolyspora phatthalungensis]MBB5157832.1 spore germination protein YaaH [Saccharopolyspora phatthalungensis]
MQQSTETKRRRIAWARPAALRWRRRRENPTSTSDDPGGTPRVRTSRRFGGSLWFLALIALSALLVTLMVMPRDTGPAKPGSLIVASLPFWNLDNGMSMVVQNQQSVNEVSPWIYGLGRDSSLTNQYPPEQTAEIGWRIEQLREAGIPIVPSLANITDGKWEYEPVARMLHDPVKRHDHVEEIVELVKREDYAGIDIDYENLRAGDRQVFTAFVTELGKALDEEGKTLSVAVFAKTSDAGYDERNVAQDYAAIGRAADEVRLMGYDFHWATSPPGSIAPITWIREVLDYAKAQIPPERVVLGVPLYGYDWVDGHGTALTWLKAFRLATEHRAKVNYDPPTQSPWFRYTDAHGREHEVWFENTASSKAKFEAARGSGIRGVYLWMYGYEDTDTWRELQQSLPLDD